MARGRHALGMALSATLSLAACDDPPAPSSPAASAGPATTASAATRAVIRIDAGHDAMTVKDAPPYVIAPSAELLLDVGQHRFLQRDGGPATPDAVHVMHGSSGYHRASFSGKQIVLDTVSLDAVKGGPFPGFEAGESYLVAVGAEAPAADGALRFAPFWTARVNVAAR